MQWLFELCLQMIKFVSLVACGKVLEQEKKHLGLSQLMSQKVATQWH